MYVWHFVEDKYYEVHKVKNNSNWRSRWRIGIAASWELWDAGLIPGLPQWVKGPTLPWPRNSVCLGVAKKIITLTNKNGTVKTFRSIITCCVKYWKLRMVK